MKTRLLLLLGLTCMCCEPAALADGVSSGSQMDADLLEVTIPTLQNLYSSHRYSVTQVVQWYFNRIDRYNGIYRAIETPMRAQALALAREEDEAASHDGIRGALWGIPIVIKANTSIAGEVTTDGWSGFTLPGHELIAPRDATIVAKLRAAGAIIIGHTNMPDFADSDTNRSSSFGRTGNAYDVRFSPGGSSGGTVTAVTANMALLGNGSDTGNSIRMPAATSAVIGVFPTRGLVSIAGVAPLDWLLDNTGPIARTVADAAVALSVMAGEDPLDSRTLGSAVKAQPGPYTRYLHAGALQGRRFGVPAFILKGTGIPFHGIPAAVSEKKAQQLSAAAAVPLQPETLKAFMGAVEELRAAGATVVFDKSILPESFAASARRISTYAYVREGTQKFLQQFGPTQYRSVADYQRATGSPLSPVLTGSDPAGQSTLEAHRQAQRNYFGPLQRTLKVYMDTLDKFQLDGFVYPAIQMPPPDETLAQNGHLSDGPHSATSWINMLGVPAVVVVGGFYPVGLPFGLEFCTRPWKDGDLLGYAYAWEHATHHRHPPVLVEQGLLSDPGVISMPAP